MVIFSMFWLSKILAFKVSERNVVKRREYDW